MDVITYSVFYGSISSSCDTTETANAFVWTVRGEYT